MVRKRLALILAVCVCICLLPVEVLAVNTADACELISTDEMCTLNLTFAYDGEKFKSSEILLYKIADVSADYQYTYTEKFSDCTVKLNGISSDEEWKVLKDTLHSYITSKGISADFSEFTDDDGKCSFTDLSTGLYYIPDMHLSVDEIRCYYDSAIVAVPNLNETDGTWNYDVSVYPKPESDLTPVKGDLKYTVIKLWKDEKNRKMRPKSVEIDIYKNDVPVKTVILSDENNWSYSWIAEDDGSYWTVAEKNIPKGYTMTVENRSTTFVVTNAAEYENTTDTPKTGDTNNIVIYAAIMCVSGIAIIIIGIFKKRERK